MARTKTTRDDTIKAATAGSRGPGGSAQPNAKQAHTWAPDRELTDEELEHSQDFSAAYEKQLDMPVHLMTGDRSELKFIDAPGTPENDMPVHTTACGFAVGQELLRTTDDAKQVTCPKCKG